MKLTRRQALASAALLQPARPARLRCAAAAGEDLRRLHLCDLKLRPIPVQPAFQAGAASFDPPAVPFRIAFPLAVPGFGHVVVYADNRGRGHTRQSLADKELSLEAEFAADRIAAVEALLDECRREGVVIPPAIPKRLGKARAARPLDALAEALWAGEELTVERARQAIARRGPRPGFLFGCNTYGFPRAGRPYADRFEALFNYGTLPFYLRSVEPVLGQPHYGNVEKILSWLQNTRILAKGHPLVWFYPQTTPDWLRNLPFAEAKRLALDYARRSVLRFRRRIHAWDVINEAHLQNTLNFTIEQQLDVTAAAARVARDADPTCFRVLNACCTWGDYLARGQGPGQQSVYDYLVMVRDARIDYEALGLQYYYAARDLLELERSIETFRGFGKPIHITELGLPSSSEDTASSSGGRPRYPWHGARWTETTQADWVEQFYTIAYSKPYIEAVTWWDLNDPAFIPHGGLLRPDLTPKESYHRLAAWLKQTTQAS